MIQLILELLAWIGLDYADYKHRKQIRKKEKDDGIKRPFQKYVLQPSSKIVLFIIILTSLIAFLFFSYQRSFIFPDKTKKEILEISNWIEKWKAKYGRYPNSLDEAIENNPMKKKWYKDSWNIEYRYLILDNGNSFLLKSAGKDGQFETKDDISPQ